jgi:hypothetical protein
MLDRLTDPLEHIVKGMVPNVDYFAWYRARVVRESLSATTGKMTVDVLPDDARIPPMSGVHLKLGLPATQVQITPGAYVQVGWENGDPAKPQASMWDGGEADALKMVFTAVQLFLGAEAGAEPTIRGATYLTAQATLNAALIAAFSAMAAASTTPPLSTLAPSFTAIAAALTAFQAAAAGYPTIRARVF